MSTNDRPTDTAHVWEDSESIDKFGGAPDPDQIGMSKMESKTAERTASRKVLNALERVFVAEIDGRLPFQSKAKIYAELCDDGMVQPMERTFGHGWSAATVRGYELTHAGRLLYCASCDDEDMA